MCSFETNDNEDVNGMMGNLHDWRRQLEHKRKTVLQKERQLQEHHEDVSVLALLLFLMNDCNLSVLIFCRVCSYIVYQVVAKKFVNSC